MNNNSTWLITGATSAISQAFAKLAAQAGCDLILWGRNQAELEIIANDLRLRYQIHCTTACFDLKQDCTAEICATIDATANLALFIAHSVIMDNQALDRFAIEDLITVNITRTAQLIHTYWTKQQAQHTVIFLSSVAACRGRAKNSLYGASKKAIETYLEGLQQAALPTQHISIARLGYIDTKQTRGLPGIFYASPPEKCAEACWAACQKGQRQIFHPHFWRFIMLIIQRIPFQIYRRFFLV